MYGYICQDSVFRLHCPSFFGVIFDYLWLYLTVCGVIRMYVFDVLGDIRTLTMLNQMIYIFGVFSA